MLKRLEIVGFKSFAKKMSLDFSSSVTAIVGPNGSGKSNVAEAFRFALGEQSMKSMRGKRSEDLIWNGSHTIARQNRASVKMTFDNTKKIFPKVDFDEVEIERVVYRDGQSEYAINGSKVRLRDIQELLAGANVGATGHHIISQGEADRILIANPEMRRAMLEDALGLKIFEFKKQEALRKLEKTRENMTQVEALRKEIIPHLRFLQKQVERVERAEAFAQELVSLCHEYFAVEELYLSQENESAKARLENAKERYAVAQKEYEDLVNDEIHTEKSRALAQLVSQAQRHHDTLLLEASTLSRELGRIEGVIDLAQERAHKEKEEEIIRISQSDIRALEEKAVELFERKREDSLLESITSLYEQVISFCRRYAGTHLETTEDTTLAQFQSQKTELLSRDSALKDALESAKEEVSRTRAALSAHEEAGRAGQQKILEIAENKSSTQALVTKEESRLRELAARQAEFQRDRAEVFALTGSRAFSYTAKDFLPEQVDIVQEESKRKIEKLKIRVEEAGGTGDDVKKEFEETKKREEYLASELIDLEKSATGLEELIAGLSDELNKTFGDGLSKINASFAEFFALMFGGGTAKLSLEDMRSRVEEEGEEGEMMAEVNENRKPGIEIAITLPRKKVQSLMQLSGGERALTSIALIFAMSQVNPPPFLILDETDAALDEANSRRYGDMIESLASRSQLVVITHNRETMSRAGILYGVTMANDGVSKLLSVKFDEAVSVAK
jgi:chromosome segregation protein